MSEGIVGKIVLSGSVTGAIGNIVSVGMPTVERTMVDTSSMSSVDDFMTFVGGMIDAGEGDFGLVFDKTDTTALHTAIEAAVETWTMTFSDTSTWACSGLASGIGGGSADMANALPFGVKIKFTGKPTYTAAA